MRIVFMGTPQFAVPILGSLLRSPYQVVAVYTQPDKPAGRRQRLTPSPVKELAMEHKIPVIQPNTLKSAEIVQDLASLKPELIVVAAFGQILPREVLSLPKFGCLNIHPSLLPQHRGPSPVANAFLCGDLLTGVTIILMDEGLDSGPILAREKVGIAATDTTGSLTAKLAHVGAGLLMDTLPKWLKGELEPQPQGESQATYSRLITSKDGEIDWHLPAVELWQRVRAFNPWPSCYTWWQGKRLKIHSAAPVSRLARDEVGKVIALRQPPSVGVVTGEGILGLCQVQLEGRHEMSIADFVRGQRNFIGSILGSDRR
ncbi:MAG: methionyl-tRNA formyltransferase [Dehalococcoidia bacterium]|nr:methionyl-tRNA formyltransferase [Dehalococcoidia bacterium]MDH5781721.1 methionyl-tRNA formyltransferase [Dehalococcoidia bacterium]